MPVPRNPTSSAGSLVRRREKTLLMKERRRQEAARPQVYLLGVLPQLGVAPELSESKLYWFRKILKKRDKNLGSDAGFKWQSEHVDQAVFHANKDINKLIQETEATFINDLEAGNRQKAMNRLRVPPLGDQQSPWTAFKVGLFSGACVVLVVSMILSAVYHDYYASKGNWRIVFRLYRGPFLIIIFIFLMGVNVYGWRSSGVNHVLIFELDPRNHLSEQHLMELASILGVIWTSSVLMFNFSDYLVIPAYANPLALNAFLILFLLNPFRIWYHEARFWALRILGRILSAPFFAVNFADFWLADQLNSLVPVFTDFHYVVCFYASHNATVNNNWQVAEDTSLCVGTSNWFRPLVMCLPAWFRFAQCLRRYRDSGEMRHLVNAGKYSTTFFVVLFSSLTAVYAAEYDSWGRNPFCYVWIVSSIVSTLYAYIWDIKMDWGLLDEKAGENTFLREEIVYESRGFYYFAIVEDLVLRFGWAISFSLTESVQMYKDVVIVILSPLEVFRRFVWNFLRLENEHLNNCGKYRAIRDISVTPINASDQELIIKLMDDEDGVLEVRKRKNTDRRKTRKSLIHSTSLQPHPEEEPLL